MSPRQSVWNVFKMTNQAVSIVVITWFFLFRRRDNGGGMNFFFHPCVNVSHFHIFSSHHLFHPPGANPWYGHLGRSSVGIRFGLVMVDIISHFVLVWFSAGVKGTEWVYAPISPPQRMGLLGLLGNPNNTSLKPTRSTAIVSHTSYKICRNKPQAYEVLRLYVCS